MKKSLIYLVALATIFGLLPVVNLNFASAQSCDPDSLTPVRYGQRGSAVKALQECLIELGYNIPSGATGYYGNQTAAAVLEFYRDANIQQGVALRGRSFGSLGISALRQLVASTETETEDDTQNQTQTQTQTGGAQQNFNEMLAAVLEMLRQLGVLPSTSTQQQQQQQTGEEGFLTVERDPSVGIVTLREGETRRVAGIRFKADSGALTVKSILLRWQGGVAPHRAISALALKDSSGNVLYQTPVGPSTFLQDSSLNYYLPISSLNVQVPRNGYNSVFVEVTVVGTLPQGVNSASFYVNNDDIRAIDGAGVSRFGNQQTWTFNLQTSISGSAYFVGARNINSPLEGYVTADDVTRGTADEVLVYKFDLTAKNDNLRLTQITGSVSNTSTVSGVYLRNGNIVLASQIPSASNKTFTFDLVSSNFTINKDQTVTFDILVDLANGSSSTVSTFTVSIATTTGLNSLGDLKSNGVNLTSEVMHYLNVAPTFTVASKQVSVTKDQNNNTTTVTNAEFKIDIKAVGGTIYISSTSVATITLETQSTSKTATTGPSTVMQGSTPVSQTNGYYVIPEGSTYTFTFQTSGQTFANVQSVRAKLSSIQWIPVSSSNGPITATFIGNNTNFWTGFVSP
jgi:hypothetical protein